MRKILILVALLMVMGAGCQQPVAEITTFDQCVAAGNPVMESYPRQCRANGKTFEEKVAQPPAPPPTGSDGGVQTLIQLGEQFSLKKGGFRSVQGGLRVTLESIADSRCPKDVQCIWAGELAPKLLVELPDEKVPSQEVTLGTLMNKNADALGYHFALIAATETEATIVVTK